MKRALYIALASALVTTAAIKAAPALAQTPPTHSAAFITRLGNDTLTVERFDAAVAAQTGLRVLWGACDPLITPRPLGPLHDASWDAGGDLAAALAFGQVRPHGVLKARAPWRGAVT